MSNTDYYGGFAYQQLRHIGITDSTARSVAAQVKVKSFQDNQVILPKGDEVEGWHLIITGLVVACIPTTNSHLTPISLYGDGTWFGEQSIINRKPCYAEYMCLLPTDVMVLPSSVLVSLLDSEPGFARYMAGLMAWRVQKTSEMLMLMKLGNPVLRVVMGLSQFAEALAFQSSRPPTIGYEGAVEIPVTQQVLASLCGVSRSVFSEFILKLSCDKWVKLSYGKLELLSVQAWHEFIRRQRERNINNLNPTIDDLLAELRSCKLLS